MAYGSAEHEATGFIPAKLMFGREIRLPFDLSTDLPKGAELPTTYSDYVTAATGRGFMLGKEVPESVRTGSTKVVPGMPNNNQVTWSGCIINRESLARHRNSTPTEKNHTRWQK